MAIIALFGATGKLGSEILKQALLAGHMACPGNMHGSGGVAAAPSTSKCVGNVFQGPEFLRCTYADCAYYIVQEINEKKYIKKKMAFASPEFVQQQQQQQESTSIFGRVWNGLYNTFFGSSSSKL